ncbi:TadE family protein [Planctomyces sp. SH-PL62]|uniref:TadE family protein n=1 Tax=Planctomyces sp. SH-PL62 TaxID=1636152 RepID=UPI00078C0BDA|nr:TadE family protein [Planctomyces sp. SH-PL62]AMV38172.1 TadE-like protein [Planctomyces sp. SH-PL62]
MMRRNRQGRGRRGIVLVEAAVVYPVLLTLLLGTFVLGLGIFRYHQVTYLACEAARWASVRGKEFQAEAKQPAPTSATMLQFARDKAVGMDATALTGELLMTSSTATVTLRYQWVPEAYLPAVTFRSTATSPISY